VATSSKYQRINKLKMSAMSVDEAFVWYVYHIRKTWLLVVCVSLSYVFGKEFEEISSVCPAIQRILTRTSVQFDDCSSSLG
jgi:hypothetical protein